MGLQKVNDLQMAVTGLACSGFVAVTDGLSKNMGAVRYGKL